MDEVHAVPSRDESQRHEDACNYRKDRHYPVLLDVDLCLIKVSYLGRVICKGRGHVMQGLNSLEDKVEVSLVILLEEIILVLFKFLA